MRRLSAGIAAVVSSQLGVRNCATSASASAASSSGVVGSDGLEDPRRRRYVDALRTVIRAAPPSGSKVHDIASNLEILLCQDADPTKFGFTKLSQALSFLQDEYYIINRDTLVHCDWPSVLRKVRMTIPTEGVMLPAFVRHIAHLSPGFEDSSIPGCTLEQWIASKWGHLFTMIAHPTTRAFTVFRRVDVERSKKVRQVERALTLIGRHPDLPVFTDVQAIAPLLPHRGNHQTWPSQLMTKGDLVDAFDLDVAQTASSALV